MDARRGLSLSTNAIFKPLVIMAAKFLGPGRLRLEMVKLAHDLNDAERNTDALLFRNRIADGSEAIQPGRRAA
jgi:hypothetical protein